MTNETIAAVVRQLGPLVLLGGLFIAWCVVVVLDDRRRAAEHERFMAEARRRQDLRPCEDWEL